MGCGDVFFAITESDLRHAPGKASFGPRIAADLGLRPIAILWGALNLFGGGRQSLFLLENPHARQIDAQGQPTPHGCYVNPASLGFIHDQIAYFDRQGFAGYFVDEPTPINCFCPACRGKFEELFHAELTTADAATQKAVSRPLRHRLHQRDLRILQEELPPACPRSAA